MSKQGQDRGNAPGEGNPADRYSSGPSRGYIPPGTGRVQLEQPVQDQRKQQGEKPHSGREQDSRKRQPVYSGQNSVTGEQRGFAMPAAPASYPAKPKRSRRLLIGIMIFLLAAALGTAAYFAVTSSQQAKMIRDTVAAYEGLFCQGVYVDGIHLGGMTPEEGMNAVESQIRERNNAWKVRLMYEGEQLLEINADMLGYNDVDTNSALMEAWQHGHTGEEKQKYDEILRLKEEPCFVYTAKPEGNTGVIDERLAEIKAQIDKPAQDAKLLGTDWSLIYPFTFQEEEYGRTLDIEPLKTQLYQMAAAMQSGTVNLEPETVVPPVTLAELMKNYSLRADVTTEIDRHSEENRNNNIRHAFEFINGYVLEPGETFSFNSVVGERTAARGFFEADEYVYGEHQRGTGGGVCQAATTIYQAAVTAGLKILKREKHSDSVSYAGYGEDATVYWSEYRGGKKIDMSFSNNTDQPIYILAFVEDIPKAGKKENKLRTRAIIYGEDLGDVVYRLEATEVDTLPVIPSEPTNDKSKVRDGKIGHIVDSYQVQYTNGIETNRIQLAHDIYEPIPSRYYDPSADDS